MFPTPNCSSWLLRSKTLITNGAKFLSSGIFTNKSLTVKNTWIVESLMFEMRLYVG
jgi:hypothetical protein